VAPIPSDMRDMFSAECGDYLARLGEGFLALEAEPGDAAIVDRLFRVAHSLKGTARIMDCLDLHRAAHSLEDLLVLLRDGNLALDAGQFDTLSRTTDQFQALLQATLDAGPTAALADGIVAMVVDCQAPAQPGAVPPPQPAPEERPEPTTGKAPAAIPALAMDVLRVPVARLDSLINQVGELLVAHQTLAGHAQATEELGDMLEEASRRGLADRGALAQAAQKAHRLAHGLGTEEARMGRLFDALEAAIHRTRMVPLAVLLDQAPKWVRDTGRALGKAVRLQVSGAELELDKHVVEGLRDPLMHLLRNAVDHGIEAPEARRRLGKPEQGLVSLRASRSRNGLTLVLEDDGMGLDLEAIQRTADRLGLAEANPAHPEDLVRLVFRPGFSTRDEAGEFSGRGVGLDAVASQIAALKGTVQVASVPGKGTEVTLWLPQSLTRSRALVVQASGLSLGLQSASVRACLQPPPGAFQSLEGQPVVVHGGQVILLVHLGSLLGRSGPAGRPAYVVLLEAAGDQVALGVDELLGESEVLQKPLPARLRGLPLIHAFSLLGNGHIILLADPGQLAIQARAVWQGTRAQPAAQTEAARVRSILLADDSLTTRVQLRRILESAGYKVQPAVDGLDAWARLGKQTFDAVVSDVQMPGLDGYQLTARIRGNPQLATLPVVLVTTLASEEDQRRGLEVGASAYITKGSFDQEQLLEHLRRLT